ncbi:hypothetical protein [Sphingomonas ginsenosidimutans]|jgi:hypothetical protein|uniref:hypothetical protein n=1 Tax=Sphingomonas ginsenosidimutans TaxID=862134 RepID=UPI001D6550C6|nr:hypothetical protein [Sphingomonas ginsenosidimutans]MBY0301245.1 hypothetical protein [Sphingomonas ginsenosidimutans]
MADFVTIANLAASSIGEDDQMRSPDDNSHLSRSVRAVWDLERRAALRDHSWNFAMRRAALPAQALDAAPIGWGFSYKLPADCVRLIEVFDAARSAYQLEGGSVLADVTGPLRIRYIADLTEPALWDDLFVRAFAARIGFAIADRITGDRGRKDDAWIAYQDALSQAKRVDARENPQVAWAATEWERARGGFGYRDGDFTAVTRDGMLFP